MDFQALHNNDISLWFLKSLSFLGDLAHNFKDIIVRKVGRQDTAAIWKGRILGQSNPNILVLLSEAHSMITCDLVSVYTPYKSSSETGESHVCKEPDFFKKKIGTHNRLKHWKKNLSKTIPKTEGQGLHSFNSFFQSNSTDNRSRIKKLFHKCQKKSSLN